MSEKHVQFTQALKEKIKISESLIVPMPAIFETGNHIGQNGSGRQRRSTAERFATFVRDAIDGNAPFTPTPFPDPEDINKWLAEFPDWAGTQPHASRVHLVI
ncbi:MAG: hypothetical protein JKY37_12410 [Nannocystaceae bacterium]|nr:hypothetical protein [Nannocystaceae bacterium]